MSTNFTSHPGILYTIPRPSPFKPLTAFNHGPLPVSNSASIDTVHTLIFLGGLFDGLQTVPYVAPLVSSLSHSWTLVEPVLGSHYRQSGFSSLDEDVAEIEILVKFFRELRPGGKVVLLGHSTGSQQIMHYILSPPLQGHSSKRASIDGGIMQGCCSDREAMSLMATEKDMSKATLLAQDYLRTGGANHFLPIRLVEPIFGFVPVTAKRWLDLASPGPNHKGADDYFSSDLPDERLKETFGRLGGSRVRVCWLYGGQDPYVPATVDKTGLLRRWHHYAELGDAVLDEASGVVPEASHTLHEGGEGMNEVIRRVMGFLQRVEKTRASKT